MFRLKEKESKHDSVLRFNVFRFNLFILLVLFVDRRLKSRTKDGEIKKKKVSARLEKVDAMMFLSRG